MYFFCQEYEEESRKQEEQSASLEEEKQAYTNKLKQSNQEPKITLVKSGYSFLEVGGW